MNQEQITEASPGSELIKFPAMSFDRHSFGVLESMNDITRPSRSAVKKGFYRRVTLVDSSGNKFHVIDVKKLHTLFEWRLGVLLELISGNPAWRVQLTFGPPSKLSLDEVRGLILSCFKGRNEYWEEMSDFEEFRDKIVAANSMEQLFAVFREFHLM
jgi:hypothetical protein